MMEECAFRKPPQCGASHLYAERDGEGEHTRMGTDGNAIAGSTRPKSVTRDRFESKPTMPDTMGTVSTGEAVGVVGPPRDQHTSPVVRCGAAHPRGNKKKRDVRANTSSLGGKTCNS